jgi:8-oxo-dGTP diphosphatase
MKIIDKVAWIFLKDSRILSTLSKGKTKYYIPGGKRENGETDVECLKREINEELSVELIDQSISYFDTFQAQADSHADGIIVRMRCYFADYRGELCPNNEIDRLEWMTYQDRLRSSAVDQKIFQALLDKGLLI